MARAAGNKGYYNLGLLGPDGQPIPGREWHFPSVTTVLDDVIAKPRLQHWYYTQTIEGVVTLFAGGKRVPSSGKTLRGMLNSAGLSPYSKRDKAAKAGTATHTLFEVLQGGGSVVRDTATAGILDWWDAKGLTPDDIIATEVALVSFEHRFAGTVDLIYCDPATGRTVLCDLKTGANVYWTHFLQGEAYKRAWEEEGNEVDLVSVLHCPVGGTFRECIAPEVTFSTFKNVLDIWYSLPSNWKPEDLEDPIIEEVIDDGGQVGTE